MIDFSHLHCHSSIGSMADSMATIEQLFEKASKLGQKALAITDHGSCAGFFDAYNASKKHDVKFIPGCEFYFVHDLNNPKEKRKHLVLLAKNEIGYKNLLKINYEGFINKIYVAVMNKVFPRIDWNILEKYKEGIICLSACSSGPIARALLERDENDNWNKEQCFENGMQIAQKLLNIFSDDFYLELQPHHLQVYKRDRKTGDIQIDSSGMPILTVDQKYLNQKLIDVSKKLGINMVATCDAHYLNQEDAEIHDMLMAINSKEPLSSPTRHRYGINEFYMKSGKEVSGFFEEHYSRHLGETLCRNSCIIARKCETPNYLDIKDIRFPQFPISDEPDYVEFQEWRAKQGPSGETSEDRAFMRFRCILGFKKKFSNLKKDERKQYIERMKKEIKVLEQHNFCSYMLIVSDYIQKAKKQGISIGPGRGSVCGSLVGYLLDIHTVNPMEYGLIFERFHNKEKKSFPDIDTDIQPDGRAWIQNYITEKYGKEKVAHVSNLSRMTPKVIVKDIARSLELGGSKSKAFQIANKITDSIPDGANTFEEAYQESKEFRNFCEQFPDLRKYGIKLAGLEKSYATHAAGIVISDIDLSTFVPLRIDKEGAVSVQYEKERCEALGLIKMDLLGLEHLKIIDNSIRNIKKLGFNPKEELWPYDDPEIWKDISEGKTACVFQMGSPHMRALCKKIKPQSIEELGLVNTLGRPSLARFREDYISRKNKSEQIEYKYPCIKPAVKDTLGVCVYEDQLMKLANVVAGWDLNKADDLRRITKGKGKHPELTEKTKRDFVSDAVKHSNIGEKEAEGIWVDIISPFEGYGFNLSHATAYSINGYYTAYYAHYYPSAFMAAVLESETSKPSSPARDSNIREYKKETRKMGINIVVPDINISGRSFEVKDKNTIITGLNSIKDVGDKAINEIMKVRNEHQFKSFEDFLLRTSSSIVKKNVIQALAKSGCFDSLNITRKNAHDYYATIRTEANKHCKKVASEGRDSWNILNDFVPKFDISPKDDWDLKTKLKGEQEVLGECISGTINDLYDGFFTSFGISLNSINSMPKNYGVKIESIITNVKQKKLKKGKNAGRIYADCLVSDRNKNTAQLTIWPEQWAKFKEFLIIGRAVRAVCKVNVYNGGRSLVLERIENLSEG